MASDAARRRCTSARASAPVIRRLVPSAAAAPVETRRPLPVTRGRRWRAANSRSPRNASTSSARTPRVACTPASRSASCRVVAGVVDRVHDARDAGLDERLRARPSAARVIAGLERHDRGRTARRAGGGNGDRVDLGVRDARTAVPSLGEHVAVGGKDDASHPGVHPASRAELGQFERPAHGGIRRRSRRRGHRSPALPGSRIPAAPETPTTLMGLDHVPPPIRTFTVGTEFHRFNRSRATGRSRAPGSRTFTAGSELHRPRSTFRVRFWSTPERRTYSRLHGMAALRGRRDLRVGRAAVRLDPGTGQVVAHADRPRRGPPHGRTRRPRTGRGTPRGSPACARPRARPRPSRSGRGSASSMLSVMKPQSAPSTELGGAGIPRRSSRPGPRTPT